MKGNYKLMKKVMVHAVTKLNLGDDLFLKILFERYPNTNFVLSVSDQYKKNYDAFENTIIYSSSNSFNRLTNFLMRKLGKHVYKQRKIAQMCDASIHIGGSIFQQKSNWKNQLKNRIAFSIKNQPFYVIGANFGSYKDESFYNEYYKLFKEYEDICFREEYSYNLFKELNNVRKADDVVFSLEEKIKVTDEKKVVISVIQPSFRPYLENQDQVYYEKIKDITINYVKDGYEVVLMSFCEAEGDEVAIQSIQKIIPIEYVNNVRAHKYYGDIEAALTEVASASAIIATRFHSMILGWIYGKPTIPISYNDKMFNVMKDVGYKGKYINFDNLNELVYEDYRIQSNMEIIDISKQKSSSEKQFYKLDQFLYS